MFKMSFLQMRTNAALKKNKFLRGSTPYKQAQSFGIIFSVEDKQKHDDIKELVKTLEQDGKKVKVLEFLPKKKENFEFLYDFFTIENLNFWGKINSASAEKFSKIQFDYLFIIDTQSNPLIYHLLANSKAHCRVGKFDEDATPFLDFMIETNGSVQALIDNMYEYTRKLR